MIICARGVCGCAFRWLRTCCFLVFIVLCVAGACIPQVFNTRLRKFSLTHTHTRIPTLRWRRSLRNTKNMLGEMCVCVCVCVFA